MAKLTPGIVYIARSIHKLLFPPLLVCLTAYLADQVFNVKLPLLFIISSCLLSLPTALWLSIQWSEYRVQHEAAAHGAVLPRSVDSKLPFGLDIAKQAFYSFKHEFFANHFFEWSRKYGYTFRFGIFGEKRYFTSEPEYIKSMLATDFNSFAKGSVLKFQMQSLFGDGVFNVDGDMWKFHRGMTRPFFSKDRIGHFDIFDRNTEEVLRLIQKRNDEGCPVDFQELILRFTLDSATEFLFGKNVNSLSDHLLYPPTAVKNQERGFANKFAEEFALAQWKTTLRGRFSTAWPLTEITRDRVADHMDAINAVVDPIIQNALEKKSRQGEGEKTETLEDDTLLSHLINVSDDPSIIRDETLNILLAGRDTTAATLTFAIYELSRHPEMMQRLREEILSKVGPTRRPTYEDIKDLKYLRAFLNEVLRLYPPVALNVRSSTQPMVWSTAKGRPPIYVAPNTRVAFSCFVMHRRKDLWGPDATTFDPDRFIDERLNKYLLPNPFIFLPFNGGPRICLGQQFAYNEMSFMIIRLLQRFSSIELFQKESVADPDNLPSELYLSSEGTDGTDQIRIKNHIIIYSVGGLWVKMKPANDAQL
ncbi:cytochrome P450 [Abortiporus biennis]|nr:cytochrome P450 [Abortiporus biennis]